MAHFEPEERIRLIAEAYALDAVDFAAKQHRIVLDWSDESIRHVETILDALYKTKPKNVSDELILQFAKMFGSYVGEVFRKNHGATWGRVTLGDQTFAGMAASGKKDNMFWPWGRAQNRLINGEEDNVWLYYMMLVET